MKKTAPFMLALVLAVGLLTGCAGKDPKTGPVAGSNADGTTEASYVPIPDLTDPTLPSDPVVTFPIQIEDPQEIPEVEQNHNLTPEEFAEVLLVENRAPFTSQYMECDPEDFERRENVYALGITNISDKTIADLTLTYSNGERDLVFFVEMLPAGWTVVPMDTEGTAVTSTELTYVSGEVNYLTTGREVTDEVELTETRNSTIIVRNMTQEEMQSVIVYYRDVDYQGNVMAGRCFSTASGALIPGWQEELETEQWLPSCVIVNVVVLDEPATEEETP